MPEHIPAIAMAMHMTAARQRAVVSSLRLEIACSGVVAVSIIE